jgi:microcystin-dependent protein
MSSPFLGQIQLFGFNFAPTGWLLCSGQILPIAQYSALYSLLGTFYGGDGRATFALPNLNGRVAMGIGQGPGLTQRVIGETEGEASVTLLAAQMPSHTHALTATGANATTGAPAGNQLATVLHASGRTKEQGLVYGTVVGTNPTFVTAPNALATTGGNQAHNNMQPYVALNYCIAITGIFPARS